MNGHCKRAAEYNARKMIPMPRAICRGFTMVELVIVILIVGILAAAGAPRYVDALDGAYARAAAARVASDLKYARQLAQQTSTNQTVTFDLDTNSYTLAGASDRDRRHENFVVTLSDDFSSEINTANFNGSSSVIFDVYGHANNAGTVVVESGSRAETVVVDAYGLISIQ